MVQPRPPLRPPLIALFVLGAVYLMWALLSYWTNYNSWLRYLAWKLRRSGPTRPSLPAVFPMVTVQLPVFNEATVVARLLEASGALDWPVDRLEIQLLDDSTDGTPVIAGRVIAQLRARGLRVAHVRRADREGYKAGALRNGLRQAHGEFILILDADFVPPPNLLRQLIPWLNDPAVAMAQGRWTPLTPPRSMIERSAGLWIDRHFAIDQLSRSRSGQFFHFNGSGGVWRRTAIEDAGGWSEDTLAEDLDLSFRAWQRGWKFVFDDDAIVPAEVPSSVAALRIQQSRWSRGAFQVSRKAIPRLRAARWRDRVTVSLHLTGYVFPVLILALALTTGPAVWARGFHPLLGLFAADIPAVAFFIGLFAQVGWQLFHEGPRAGWLEIEAAAIGIGMAPLVARAGLSGLRSDGGEFRRTPKATRASSSAPPMVYVEGVLGLAALGNAWWAIAAGSPHMALLPLLAGAGLLAFAWRTIRP
ncbi:MAG: glycosyltransferase [Gemmatimonadaceae bacterium]|nr:glycosyltransferase [Gemmatimonadaceae bacterium]